MRVLVIVALASAAISTSAFAQISTGGVTVGPQGTDTSRVQHTTAARLTVGGPQAAGVSVVTGQDSPVSQNQAVAPPATNVSSSNIASAEGGVALTDQSRQTAPEGYVHVSAGQRTAARTFEVNPSGATSGAAAAGSITPRP